MYLYKIKNNGGAVILCGAVQEIDRGGTAEPTEIRDRSGHHDDRSSLTRRLHDVP